ncbi:hypothetical protein JB92DRAFT_2831573 [Gautieria morchelliformis]|nr:hypothetical protein JB92DRAFT_2831573 [Gautieria morchelliformis]
MHVLGRLAIERFSQVMVIVIGLALIEEAVTEPIEEQPIEDARQEGLGKKEKRDEGVASMRRSAAAAVQCCSAELGYEQALSSHHIRFVDEQLNALTTGEDLLKSPIG